jgi:hypothetical protein
LPAYGTVPTVRPMYVPPKLITPRRPVAARASWSAVSFAIAPVMAGSTRSRPGGAIPASRS